LQQIETLKPDAVVVGGELVELPGFTEFSEVLRRREIAIVPIWVFPFSRTQVETLFNLGKMRCVEESVPDGDTSFLTETILSAVRCARLESRGPSARSPNLPDQGMHPILIGASTGGVEALHKVLSAFPATCPPTLIVQHMRPLFMAKFVDGLNRICGAEVREAWDGAPLKTGRIYVAPGGETHLTMTAAIKPQCRLIAAEPRSGHRPSIDVLFTSAAHFGQKVVAALLTGMGRDGADGLLSIRQGGGHTMAQDQATSVVYGMPRSAVELDAAIEVLPLSRIGTALLLAANVQAKPAGRIAG
jgi:two-component system chemotaxis response regulator CheB